MAEFNAAIKNNYFSSSAAEFDKQLSSILKTKPIELSTSEFDKQLSHILKARPVNLSTSQVDKQYSGRNSVEISGNTRYYAMRGRDNVGYKTWIATGSPDITGAQYSGSISGTMQDIVILQSWSA